MNIVNEISKRAIGLDACDNYRKQLMNARNVSQLMELLYTPQGLEFCEEHNFPTLRMWRSVDKDELASCSAYVDTKVHKVNQERVVVVGDSEAVLEYDNTDCGYTVVVMHGARVTIKASGYASVFVTDCGGEVTKIITDNALIL